MKTYFNSFASRKNRASAVTIGLIFTQAAIGLAGLSSAFLNIYGLEDAKGATKTLQDQGYTDIKTKGHAWFTCGKGDLWHTKFEATNPAGTQKTSGVVCKGIFKGSTIRFN